MSIALLLDQTQEMNNIMVTNHWLTVASAAVALEAAVLERMVVLVLVEAAMGAGAVAIAASGSADGLSS